MPRNVNNSQRANNAFYYIGLMDSGKTFTAMQAQFNLTFKPNYNPYMDEGLNSEMSDWLRYEENSINMYEHSTLAVGYLAILIKNNEIPTGTYITCNYNTNENGKWTQIHNENIQNLRNAGFQVR